MKYVEGLVSVIMPTYKRSEKLLRAIDSVLNQTYKNLEIILVDDGSTDGSGEICNKYEQQDERIRVIHKKNGGAADARNKGLEVMTGKFVSFVDSDDWIEYNFYENNLYHFESKEEAIESLDNIIKDDDVILVKASRGMNLEKVVEYLNK